MNNLNLLVVSEITCLLISANVLRKVDITILGIDCMFLLYAAPLDPDNAPSIIWLDSAFCEKQLEGTRDLNDCRKRLPGFWLLQPIMRHNFRDASLVGKLGLAVLVSAVFVSDKLKGNTRFSVTNKQFDFFYGICIFVHIIEQN